MNDHCFGLAWSGHMTEARMRRLMAVLPDGASEIYFHPAARRDAVLRRLMPDYEHDAELAALLSLRDPATDAGNSMSVTGDRANLRR
jgi:YdjC-like protein